MNLVARLRERLADWRRERRIAHLRAEASRLFAAGDRVGARAMCELMFHECRQRSAAQVRRMERPIFGADAP